MAIGECESEKTELCERRWRKRRSRSRQRFPYQWKSTQLGLPFDGELHVPHVVIVDTKKSSGDEAHHDDTEDSDGDSSRLHGDGDGSGKACAKTDERNPLRRRLYVLEQQQFYGQPGGAEKNQCQQDLSE